MHIIVDSHQDLAWNMLCFGRDYTRSVQETRALEVGSIAVEKNGDTLLGYPEYQSGNVAVIFATSLPPPPVNGRETGSVSFIRMAIPRLPGAFTSRNWIFTGAWWMTIPENSACLAPVQNSTGTWRNGVLRRRVTLLVSSY